MSNATPTQLPDWVIQSGGFDYEHRAGVHSFSAGEGAKTRVETRTLRLGLLPDRSRIEVLASTCQRLEIYVGGSRWSTLALIRPPPEVRLTGYMAAVEVVASETNTTFEAPNTPNRISVKDGGSVRLVPGDQERFRLELDQSAGSTAAQGWLESAKGKTNSLKILASTDSETTVDVTGLVEVDANSSGAFGEIKCTSLQLGRSIEVGELQVEGDLAIPERFKLDAGKLAVLGHLSGRHIRCTRSFHVDGAVTVGRAARLELGGLELSGPCFANSIEAAILTLNGTLDVVERVEVRELQAVGSDIRCVDLVADSIAAAGSEISCISVRCVADCEVGAISCAKAEFGSHSKSIDEYRVGDLRVGGADPGTVVCHRTLKTDRLTGVGDAFVLNLVCDEELALRGAVYARDPTGIAAAPIEYDVNDLGEIRVDTPQRATWGSVSLRGSARAGSIITGTLRSDADTTKVDGLLWAQIIEGSGRTIVADVLRVHRLQGSGSLNVDGAGAVNIVEDAWVASIRCTSLVLEPDCSVRANVIEADVLRCSGKLSAELRISDLLIATDCSIEGAITVAGDCEVDAGSSVKSADRRPAVTWRPVNGPRDFRCEGDVRSILLAQGVGIVRGSTMHKANLTAEAGDFALFPNGEEAAEFSMVEVGRRARVVLVSEAVALRLPALVPINAGHRGPNLDICTFGQHEVDISWNTSFEAPANPQLRICCRAETTLTVDPPRELMRLEVQSDCDALTATFAPLLASAFGVTNAPLKLRGHFSCVTFAGETPIAIPERATQVEGVRGHLWLDECAGYIAASQTRWDERPARIVRVGRNQTLSEESSVIRPTAQIVGFDVTGLLGSEIRSLGEAEVFEPERRAVRRWAKEPEVAPEELRRRSQRSLTLMKALDGKSSSGSTRSTVGWSAARLQHRDRISQHRVEYLTRWLYWMVGYGQRPLPPLLVTLAVAAFWTAFSIRQDVWILDYTPFDRLFCTEQPASANAEMPVCVDSSRGLAVEYVRSLTFPFRLLRFSQDIPPFPYLVDWLRPIAGLTVGLPFLFFVWATRRFFVNVQDK